MTCSRCHEDLEPWWSWCPFCGTPKKARRVRLRQRPMNDRGFTIGRYWPTEAAWAKIPTKEEFNELLWDIVPAESGHRYTADGLMDSYARLIAEIERTQRQHDNDEVEIKHYISRWQAEREKVATLREAATAVSEKAGSAPIGTPLYDLRAALDTTNEGAETE